MRRYLGLLIDGAYAACGKLAKLTSSTRERIQGAYNAIRARAHELLIVTSEWGIVMTQFLLVLVHLPHPPVAGVYALSFFLSLLLVLLGRRPLA